MEHRTANDYEELFRCFVDKFAPQLRTLKVRVHCDFEKGEVAWKRVVPSALFGFCLFHFQNIQWRHAKAEQLFKSSKRLQKTQLSDKEQEEKSKEKEVMSETMNNFRLMLVLPHLPKKRVADDKLIAKIKERLSPAGREKMHGYFEYFDKNWIKSKQNPPLKWNIANEAFKTNNFSESGNRLMSASFGKDHPQPWSFVKSLVHYHNTVAADFDVSDGNVNMTREKLINVQTERLLTGKISRIQFLEKVSKVTCRNMQLKYKKVINIRQEEVGGQDEDDEGVESNGEVEADTDEGGESNGEVEVDTEVDDEGGETNGEVEADAEVDDEGGESSGEVEADTEGDDEGGETTREVEADTEVYIGGEEEEEVPREQCEQETHRDDENQKVWTSAEAMKTGSCVWKKRQRKQQITQINRGGGDANFQSIIVPIEVCEQEVTVQDEDEEGREQNEEAHTEVESRADEERSKQEVYCDNENRRGWTGTEAMRIASSVRQKRIVQ